VQRSTVVVSFVIHAGVAAFLMGAAKQGKLHKSIAVAISDVKKKPEPPKPPPPPPPKPRHIAPKVVAAAPKPAPVAPAAAPRAAPKAVQTALAMSNDDAPGGIAMPVAGGPSAGAAPAAAAAPRRVASAASDARTRRAREALSEGSGSGSSGTTGDEPCTEEPTKPQPVFKVEPEYTVAARTEGIEGKLKVKMIVGIDGSVTDVEVLSGVEPALDAAAVAAVKQWRFKPAMACGKPVAGGTWIYQKRYELTD
jgi:protein TonB